MMSFPEYTSHPTRIDLRDSYRTSKCASFESGVSKYVDAELGTGVSVASSASLIKEPDRNGLARGNLSIYRAII